MFSKDKTKLFYFPLGKAYETGGDIPEGKMRPLSYAMNIRGLRSQLEAYCIYQRGVTLEEFEEIIHEEHDKVWGRGEKSCFSPKMRVKALE